MKMQNPPCVVTDGAPVGKSQRAELIHRLFGDGQVKSEVARLHGRHSKMRVNSSSYASNTEKSRVVESGGDSYSTPVRGRVGKVAHTMTTFAERIALAAKQAGVTRNQLAQHLGQTKSNMSHWWTGRARNPSAASIASAAQFLGVSAAWLALGEGPMREQQERATVATGATLPTPQEQAAMLEKELAQLCDAWLALPESERRHFKRQIETRSLQYREPANAKAVSAYGRPVADRDRQPV